MCRVTQKKSLKNCWESLITNPAKDHPHRRQDVQLNHMLAELRTDGLTSQGSISVELESVRHLYQEEISHHRSKDFFQLAVNGVLKDRPSCRHQADTCLKSSEVNPISIAKRPVELWHGSLTKLLLLKWKQSGVRRQEIKQLQKLQIWLFNGEQLRSSARYKPAVSFWPKVS